MRRDGRASDKIRPVKVTTGYIRHAEGSALIEMGDTRVICTASLDERVPPFLRESGEGWITAEYGMLPRSTPTRIMREGVKGKTGRAYEIQRIIGRSLRAVVDRHLLGERTILLDCDVIQADGGTRTAAITGSFIALVEGLRKLKKLKVIRSWPVKDSIAAVSVGIVKGKPMLDLTYEEDSRAQLDMNIVMTGDGRLVEVQGTAEEEPFTLTDMDHLLTLARKGIDELVNLERKIIGDINS